jgi:hypothetical protein
MSDESQWVVAPDEARIEVAVGKDAHLSPDVQAALEQLAQALEAEQEVSGYSKCEEVTITQDCRWYMSCKGVTG